MNSATDFSRTNAQSNLQTDQPTKQQTDSLAGSGLVVVDKPAGMTSHDVVGKLRRIFRTKKVGHAGTLDPMATGVLVAGIERGTKFLAHMVAATKSYQATIRLGAGTTTDDAQGDFLPSEEISAGLSQSQIQARLAALSDDEIYAAAAAWTGTVEQVPAKVSAIKIDGKRAHQRVRDGEHVEIPARTVTISSFEIHSINRSTDSENTDTENTDNKNTDSDNDQHSEMKGSETSGGWIDIACTVACSSGTYIRSLARDIGADLGVGGHLTVLRRTQVGPYSITDAQSLDELADAPAVSLSLDEALTRAYPTWQVTEQQAHDLSMGKRLPACGLDGIHAAVAPDGRAIALVTEGTEIRTIFVARPSTL